MKNRLTASIKITPIILAKIAEIDEFKGSWKAGLALSPYTLGQLKRSVIITSAGSSTRIEGAKMSDREIERLIRGLKTHPPKGRDAEEVAGYVDLIGRIFDHHESMKFSESQILHFHSILLRFSQKDQRHFGNYKKSDNIVVARNAEGKDVILFRPTPPYLVKKEMDDVLYWTNEHFLKKTLHPLLVIAQYIFEFLAIHPFIDGNGRLSRALTNFLLLKAGYSYVPYVSLEAIIEEKQTEYYLSLRATQKNHKTPKADISPWLNFFLDVLCIQAKKAKALLDAEQPEKLLSEKQTRIFELFQKYESLGIRDIHRLLDGAIAKPTIKQALSRLFVLKLIERRGLGRATRYYLIRKSEATRE